METFNSRYELRKNNFNFFRLFFAVAVIVSHSYPIVFGLERGDLLEPLRRFTLKQVTLGDVSVDAFFVMSGFLLAASWQNSPSVKNFIGRRFLRIYPGFVACLFVCVLVIGPLGGVPLDMYVHDKNTYRLLEYMFLTRFWNAMPGIFAHNPVPEIVNSSLWSIKYEIMCYALLVLFGLSKLIKDKSVILVAAACYIGYNLALRASHPLPFALDAWYMPRLSTYFFVGSALFIHRRQVPYSLALVALSAILLLIGARTNSLCFIAPICLSYLLLYICFAHIGKLSQFGRRWDLSYGIYLYGWPVQQLLWMHGIGVGSPLLLSLFAVPLAALCAVCSWLVVEKPAIGLKDRRLKNLSEVGDETPATEKISASA